MSVSELNAPAQDYLKLIWSATEWSDRAITVGAIAERLGVTPSTVSDGLRKLTQQGLLSHAPYGGIELTETGRRYAVAMVRRHRLLETFLVKVLGYGWDEVHAEAEVLEHAVSDLLIDRIDEHLGFPEQDPHGDRIPTRDGHQAPISASPLAETEAGSEIAITRISDASPAMLRYFAGLGLRPGTRLRVVAQHPYADLTSVAVLPSLQPIDLGSAAARAIWVVTGAATEGATRA
jgi:DtxR family Mn-dependent transcriptional regulator